MNPKSLNPLILPLVVSVVLVFVLAGASLWFNNKYRSASTNLQTQIDAAVEAAKQAQKLDLQAQFDQAAKNPNETYSAPGELSSISVTYPRTWSSHVIEKGGSGIVLNGYFYPSTVPDTGGGIPFALRVTLETKNYAGEVEAYNDEVDDGELKASAVTISGVDGIRLDGQIEKDINGSIILIPVRDKTLKVWTENTDFLGDFNDIILPQLSFSP